MAVPELLLALAENWDRVISLLDQPDRDQLRRLVNLAGELDSADDEELLVPHATIAAFVADRLPEDDPLVSLLDSVRLASVSDPRLKPAALTSVLLARLSGDVLTARRWILGTTWEMAADLRVRGTDPEHPDLIRLDHGSGGYAVPSFQFDRSGTPIPLVLLVNRVLGALEDPWGAAHWWLSTNPWLDRRPADLIDDRSADDELVAAAVAAVEG